MRLPPAPVHGQMTLGKMMVLERRSRQSVSRIGGANPPPKLRLQAIGGIKFGDAPSSELESTPGQPAWLSTPTILPHQYRLSSHVVENLFSNP